MRKPDALRPGPLADLDQTLAKRPDLVLMAPYLAYLVLLAVRDIEWLGLGYEERWISALIRGVGSGLVIALVWKHLPPLGKPLWRYAIPAGIVAAIGWVGLQHLFNAWGVPMRLPLPPLFTGTPEYVDPRDKLGADDLFVVTACLRIGVAVIVVPIVEELFWRGFLLRAMVNWEHFDRVKPGTFTWFSFLGTSLLSAVQHPDNWLVSIFCWMFFNLVFYWRPSLWFIIIVHGVTNLALYTYVVQTNDWIFW